MLGRLHLGQMSDRLNTSNLWTLQPMTSKDTYAILSKLLEIYDQKQLAERLNPYTEGDWCRETINRIMKGKSSKALNELEISILEGLLPIRPPHYDNPKFKFIDLFAGIGGLRKGFDDIGGACVFTSEWNKYSVRTYKANHYCDPSAHNFNEDITDVTLSGNDKISEEDAYNNIEHNIPDHDVLLAGFPCQPFSLAGVSKKNSLGRLHGFECETQGTLFFDVARIIFAKRPAAFVLENVKNLRSHDKGRTFSVIMKTLDELGYDIADSGYSGSGANDPRVIDGKHYVPQHRERIVLVGFRRDLDVSHGFTLKNIVIPDNRPKFSDILDDLSDDQLSKYTLTPKLWEYLYNYAKKHQAKGNGFGFGLVNPKNDKSVARTLSARYHKDGSEILIDRGWDMEVGERNFNERENQLNRPRRLTPKECARLMGFDLPNESSFVIPVSDTQAYKQFGNSVVVPVFRAVANLMASRIYATAGQ